EARRRALVAKLGENISLRRLQVLETVGVVGVYVHGSRIGAAVALTGNDQELARDVAMHVAATDPPYGRAEDVPTAARDAEVAHLKQQAAASGKPEHIVAKMVAGRIDKWLAEVSLLG
ncbi:MAG: elongation factor Ts, partial [Salinisphaera sp.]|nr:elongation factor Ts [Salinisphaera sp.]